MHPASSLCWVLLNSCLWATLLQPGVCESSCEPEAADRCYEDFLTSFSGILHQQSRLPPGALHNALQDLCGGLSELSQCRKDIVDGGCSVDEGRQRFDRWEAAFKAVEERACLDERLLTDLVRAHSCWNLDLFGYCVRANTSLSAVRDLLHTEFSQSECKKLQEALNGCIHAGYSGCDPEKVVRDGGKTTMHTLLNVFLGKTGCPVLANTGYTASPALAWMVALTTTVVLVQRRRQGRLV
ncbi:uncharacterized protein LOC8040912 [Ixodes scapularis]|uniref:uncharacterized protein LOC8040912 n=1 Tax=Ixodes scapularis TaxID=6945 RepID=UPI001C3956E1|nr:uncharacterized protein LOC8040912 [Ixodes scapularis]